MCCFTLPIYSVSSTNIFAREAPDGRQYLAYSMTVSAPDELAMILPLPTPEGTPEDAVTFFDLSGYAAFFDDLAQGFPNAPMGVWQGRPGHAGGPAAIAVVEVGHFEASFVPGVADLDRLDPRFRLPTEIWSRLPDHESRGFAVFKLKSGHQRIHPIAFAFPRRNRDALFFPTVHIHDGQVHRTARFDHSLFCQRSARTRRNDWPGAEWKRSASARDFVDVDRAAGLVDGARHVYRRRLVGRGANRDVYLED